MSLLSINGIAQKYFHCQGNGRKLNNFTSSSSTGLNFSFLGYKYVFSTKICKKHIFMFSQRRVIGTKRIFLSVSPCCFESFFGWFIHSLPSRWALLRHWDKVCCLSTLNCFFAKLWNRIDSLSSDTFFETRRGHYISFSFSPYPIISWLLISVRDFNIDSSSSNRYFFEIGLIQSFGMIPINFSKSDLASTSVRCQNRNIKRLSWIRVAQLAACLH